MMLFWRIVLSLFFIVAGANHFWNPRFYLRVMPPYIPYHEAAVSASGVLEILGGLGVLHPATRRLSGIGLILLLIAIFPVNVHMVLHRIPGINVSPTVLWLRLPLQLLCIAWVWFHTLRAPSAPTTP
ncbi:MAG: DoxX family protein [Ardenticatenales bacterium]|nr:DoxX family protein [Ardenticatenales bacterium]